MSQKLGTTKSPPGDNALISEIVRRLVDVYRPERIYLFGSAARGDAGPDTDYDFMVMVSDDTPRETRETKAVFKALLAVDAQLMCWCGAGGSLTSGSTSVFRSLPRL